MILRGKVCVRLAFAGACALLAVLAAEGMLRFGVIPNAFQERVAAERLWATAPHRLLILGDSFFVPFGLLGRLVAREFADRDVAVRNLAVSGTGPFEYLARLKGAELDPPPDLVLLSYYVGNDLTDVQDNPKYEPGRSGTAIRSGPPPALEAPALERWYERSYLYQALARPETRPAELPPFNWAAFEQAGIDPELVEEAQARRINPWLLQLSLRNPHHLLDNVLMETEENQRAWETSQSLLLRIHDLCRQRGAKLLAVAFPRSIQIDDSHFDFFERLRFETDPRTLTSTRPQDLLAEFCASHGIPLLDLLPAFEARGEQLYLERDDHLNGVGHHFAAEKIVPFVLEHTGDP